MDSKAFMASATGKPPVILALILGGLAALGPLAIDMYLPALPMIARDFGTDEGKIQFSVMAFLAGLTIGQLFYGPLSDRFGRKPLIRIGLGLFMTASFGCAAVTDPLTLNVLRFVQGLGGSIGMVMTFAITRDLYTGLAAAKLMSMAVMLLTLAPIVAPFIGSMIVSLGSWRIIFLVLGAFGAMICVLVEMKLQETRLPEQRQQSRLADSLRNYRTLIFSRQFIPYILASSAAQGAFFAYLASSSSIYMTSLGLTSFQYSIAFGANAVGLMGAAQSIHYLMRRIGPSRILWIGLLADVFAGFSLLFLSLTCNISLAPVAVLLFIVVTANGLIMPVTSILALESFGHISGTAAALMGAMRFAAGVLASGLTGTFADGTATPMAVVMSVCSLSAVVIAATTFPKQEQRIVTEGSEGGREKRSMDRSLSASSD